MIVKGRNRDTAWFSMLDSEWPLRKANFERWLDPSNFSEDGKQKLSLFQLNQAQLNHSQLTQAQLTQAPGASVRKL
jgi:hypothetical protein